MSYTIFKLPKAVALDTSATVLPGAKLYFYLTGTTTPVDTYTTSALNVAHTNPVVADIAGVFPVIYLAPEVTYKVTYTTAADVLLYTVDPVNDDLSLTQGEIGEILYPLTETEEGASAEPVNYWWPPIPENVTRYGAVDTGGVSDSTSEIQDTIDALNAGSYGGGVVLFPGDANSLYNISASIMIPPRTSGDNHNKWYSITSMGRGATKVVATTGMVDKPMLNINGQNASTYSFYREVKNLYFNGAGIAQRGIEAYYNQHFKIENVFITGLDFGGSVSNSAGVRVFGAICAQFRDVKVHNSDGYGIWAPDGSGNFFNANLVEGCSFLDVSLDGFYASGGWSGNAHIGNTHEFCGGYGMRLAGYSGTCGFIGGNYLESNFNGDFYFGEDTTANSVVCTGNYLNGYGAGVSSTSYTPIRVRFADGIQIVANMVNLPVKSTTGFYILDANISGGSVINSYVANNMVRDLAATTAPNQVYNLPGTWVYFGNTLIDPVFAPLIQNNVFRGRLPYGGWTLSVSGAGTAVRSANNLEGAPTLKMTRPGGGDTAQMSQAYTVGNEFKNRFVTFAVPVLANASSETIEVSITPNGTSPQTTTISVSSLASGEQTIIYAMGFAPADATTITCTVNLASAGGDFDVGHPCLYVGAQQWYSASGDQDWKNTAAPTTGTWVTGDRVFDSTPASGTPIGWGCSAGGAPGTWIAMSNYA